MNFLQKLYNSRNVLMELLTDRGYDNTIYSNFTIKELDLMMKNSTKASIELNPLDIKLTKDNKTIYIKYFLNSKIRMSNIQQLIINMKEELLEENDELIIITKDKLSNELNLDSVFETLLNIDKMFVQVFWLDTLIINITKHQLVPKHRIVTEQEKEQLLDKYSITSYNQLPVILKTDAVAKYYGMRRGNVVEITRPSETAGEYINYRYCQ